MQHTCSTWYASSYSGVAEFHAKEIGIVLPCQDSNLESSAPEADALSIRPQETQKIFHGNDGDPEFPAIHILYRVQIWSPDTSFHLSRGSSVTDCRDRSVSTVCGMCTTLHVSQTHT